MKAIPASLLTDTMTVYPLDETTDYGSQYGEPVAYERVRVDWGTGFGSGSAAGYNGVQTMWAEGERAGALVFIDAIRSIPNRPPAPRDKVVISQDGREYTGYVQAVRPFKAHGHKTHHWEVLLG